MAKNRIQKVIEENTPKKPKYMRPEQAAFYANVPVQAIRELMKRGLIDIGEAVNLKGKRWSYYIIPSKFFAYIEQEVPEEWKVEGGAS